MRLHYSQTAIQNASGGNTAASNAAGANAGKSNQYFEGNRKGEVNELKLQTKIFMKKVLYRLMKNTLNEKDDKKKREVVKKVIAYMTLGIDVSRLFTEMCMASYTNDMIQKKMIYLYLTTYAESNPDLAIMAINTFRKDCKHSDAKIRGLALRNLCSLRFQGAFEYLMMAIQEALNDNDGYVRKTAIMGCVKLFYMQPELIQRSDIVDRLYRMIKDNDPLVIINAISALNEILNSEGGIAISGKMIVYLLNRLKEFTEFNQALILEMLSKYEPKSDQEMLDIMNMLEDRLKHSCASIGLATIKVFMNFTKDKPKLYTQVIDRVKSPLITLTASTETAGNFEVTYTILSHINFISSKGFASVFEKDYKNFYCRADEPSYNKYHKLNILAQIASENNLGDMLNELGEYVTDVDSELSRRSIQALGRIAIRLPELASAIVKQLSYFVTLQKEYITNEVMIAFKDILRKQSKQIKEIIDTVNQSLDCITDPQSKIALIYILGEHGQLIPLAPYLLENYVNSVKQETLDVRHALLIATIKLFLKRAPELQPILAKLFQQILDDPNEDIDLKDRAAYYYRALQQNVTEIKNVYINSSVPIDKFLEELINNKETMQLDFNSLSVIYEKHESKFTKSFEHFNALRNKEIQEENAQNAEAAESEVESQTSAITPSNQQSSIPVQETGDLLDIVDGMKEEQIHQYHQQECLLSNNKNSQLLDSIKQEQQISCRLKISQRTMRWMLSSLKVDG